ncbi:hypothetical protein [Roseibium sediminis]|uniref:hypothetical protein n=1 Tax=Roseibium sediminis TaxID=1775174 RepID=UPI00123CE124|nr:hypothetical protein [Roseibium sediminis]
MSGKSSDKAVTVLVTVVLSTVLIAASYLVFTGANGLAQMKAGNTILTDIRFILGLLAVYLFLSFADRIIGFVQSKLGDGQ